MSSEWVEWHRQYETGSSLARRLAIVRRLIRDTLDRLPPGAIRVISMCAGDGRDLIGALATHPRRNDVRARLVELEPELAGRGRAEAERDGLTGVEFRVGDASMTDVYAEVSPADLVLVCGVFGNVTDEDVHRTVDHLPELCAAGATVVWTRGRFEPDLTPAIRQWFREAGFEELAFETVPGTTMAVGAGGLARPPPPFRPSVRLFTFLPYDERPSNRGRSPRAPTHVDPTVPPTER